MAEVEEECSASAAWSELPEDTREEVLAFLPLDCLCRSRSVCKEWNALLSSTKFITNKWAEAPLNKKPWLVLCKENNQRGSSMDCSRYCFFTRTWKNCISFSFLPRGDEKVQYFGSAQGLFLVDIPHGRNTVCNPLTRTFLQLPPMPSIKILMTRGIVGWKVDDQETYKVVAVGLSHSNDVLQVEIYDSSEKSWGVVRYLPESLDKFDLSQGIVFCDDFFYWIGLDREAGMGVLGFSILEGTSTFIPFPELANGNTIWPKLLICRSRILLAGGIGLRRVWSMSMNMYTMFEIMEVILWEFQKDSSSSSWKEIARMPPSLCEVFQRRSFHSFECVGVEDCVCFTSYRCMDFAVYNLNEETWSWLPTIDAGDGYPRVMAFKPRPDMKVW